MHNRDKSTPKYFRINIAIMFVTRSNYMATVYIIRNAFVLAGNSFISDANALRGNRGGWYRARVKLSVRAPTLSEKLKCINIPMNMKRLKSTRVNLLARSLVTPLILKREPLYLLIIVWLISFWLINTSVRNRYGHSMTLYPTFWLICLFVLLRHTDMQTRRRTAGRTALSLNLPWHS